MSRAPNRSVKAALAAQQVSSQTGSVPVKDEVNQMDSSEHLGEESYDTAYGAGERFGQDFRRPVAAGPRQYVGANGRANPQDAMIPRGGMPDWRYGPMAGMPAMAPPGMNGGVPGGMMPAAGMPNMGSVDIVGPVLRRKFLVVFLALVGAAVSFLAYVNSDVIYESAVRLMITSQAPPIIVDGNQVLPKVAIARHEKLLFSQMVLSKAVQDGQLTRLPMFQQTVPEEMVVHLQEDVLKISTSKVEDNTVLMSAKGKHAEDLPVVLKAIVQAYKDEIAKDTKNSGQESVELVSRLRQQLETEKSEAQREYFEIMARLNLPNIEQGDKLVNPYNLEMERITTLRTTTLDEHRDVMNRLQLADRAIASEDPGQMNYLAAEAKKFLGIAIETIDTIDDSKGYSGRHNLGVAYANRLFALERDLNELRLRRETSVKTLGPLHPTINSLNSQIQANERLLVETRNQFDKINDTLSLSDEMENNVAERLERRSRQWIEIYRSTLQAESDRLAAKLSQVDEDLAEIETQARAVAGDFLQLSALKARIAEKQKGIDDVLAKLSEINVVSTNFTETRTTVIDEPGIGLRVAPSLLKYLAIGIFVGGILGVGLAVLIDRSDLTYRNPGEVFERLKAPVVCKIPAARVPRRANGKAANPALIALYSPSSKLAEAIRAARTALLFAAKSQGSKVFLMTSPSPGDGKSTVTANLAISLAQSGKRVVLVDADFRRPRVHAYFDVPLEPGIMQAVSADEHLDNCLRPSSQDGLTLLSAGGRPKNPGEVVTSQEFGQLMEQLRERFDIVIIDSPPLLPVADAAVISALVDGVYMVIRIRKGVVVTSSKAKEKLDMVDAQCLGVIVNGLDDNPHYNEYGSYAYGFGSNYNVGNGSYYETRNSRYQERLEAP